jgi:hypothetical protein
MPITFAQPEPATYSHGALQAYLEAARLAQQARLHQGYGGGGGGVGGGYSPRGGGSPWPSDSSGGGRGGGGGSDPRDPVADYLAKRDIDRQFADQERQRQLDAIDSMTGGSNAQLASEQTATNYPSADQPTQGGGIGASDDRLRAMTSADPNDADPLSEYDEAGTGYVPGTDAAGGGNKIMEGGEDNTDEDGEPSDEPLPPGAQPQGQPQGPPQQQPTPEQQAVGAQETQARQQLPPPPTRLQQLQAERRQLTQGQPPSIGDRTHQAALENGLNVTNQRARTGQYTPQEANDLREQILTGLNPITRRMQAAQLAATQAAAATRMSQNAELTSIRNMDGTQTAAHVAAHTATLPDGTRIYINPVTGHEHVIPSPHIAAADRSEERQAATRLAQDKADETNTAHFHTALTALEKEVRGPSTQPLTVTQREEVKRRMIQRGFHSDDFNEHSAIRQENRQTASITGNVQRQMNQEAGGPNPPAWARTPEGREDEQWSRTNAALRQAGVRSAAPAAAPVDSEHPTTPQREMTQNFQGLSRRLEQLPVSETRNRDAQDLDQAQAMYKRFGSTAAMPPSVRRQVERVVSRLNERLPAQRSAAPAQAEAQPQATQSGERGGGRPWQY